jgi:uncharacterized membrane protein YkvA (DUF1232 family)
MSADLRPVPDRNVPERRDWRQLAREAVLVLPNVVKLLAGLARDPRVPIRRKVLAAAVLVYIVSPIDLIPEVIIGVGFVDDLIISAVAIHHLLQGAGRDVVLEHWDGSEDSLDLVLAFMEWGSEIIPSPLRRFLPD